MFTDVFFKGIGKELNYIFNVDKWSKNTTTKEKVKHIILLDQPNESREICEQVGCETNPLVALANLVTKEGKLLLNGKKKGIHYYEFLY